jgi:cyclohexanecarboxylate-CoA ligase
MDGGKRQALSDVTSTWRSPQRGRYAADGHWSSQLIDDFIRVAADRSPQRIAVVDRERQANFAELDQAIGRATGMLAGLGVGKGDVVSFQLPNWLEAAVVHHATVRLGAVSNPIVPIYRAHEVEFVLRQARSRVFIVPDVFRGFDYREMVSEIRAGLADLAHVLVVGEPAGGMEAFHSALDARRAPPSVSRDSGDVVLLLYTSGTEANPKGVLHSHDTLVYECNSIIDLYAMTGADRVLMPSPVTHITGLLYGLLMPFMVGTGVVLQDVWDVARALDLIERERCTFAIGATPFLHGLVNAPDLMGRDVSSMRIFGCGGADVPPALIRAAHERIGMVASRLYGSTECPTVTGTPLGEQLDRHADTDGRPIGASEMRIVDESGAELPPGERGELRVRGPDLCVGYLDPSLNEAAFTEDGWFRTGDIAFRDHEGYLQIAGRAKDIILRGGENLSAKEIEDLLFEHPDVEEVAVVGYPDEVLGERACAFVVTAADLRLEDVVDFLRGRRVANQKLPESLVIVDALPKTASGKIQKFRLRDQLRASAQGAPKA